MSVNDFIPSANATTIGSCWTTTDIHVQYANVRYEERDSVKITADKWADYFTRAAMPISLRVTS